MDSVDLTSLSSYQKSVLFIPARFLEYGTYRVVYKLQISGALACALQGVWADHELQGAGVENCRREKLETAQRSEKQ